MNEEVSGFKIKPVHYAIGGVVALVAVALVAFSIFGGGGDASVSDSAQLDQSKNIDTKVSTKSVGGNDSSKIIEGGIKAKGDVSF